MNGDISGFEDFIDGIDSFYNEAGSGFGSAATGALVVSNIISSIIALAAIVLVIVALWKIFEKAGKPGWHALIPFLNVYDIFQISWTRKMGIATIVLQIVSIVGMIFSVVFLAMAFGTGYIDYLLDYRSGSFGRSLFQLESSAVIWVMLMGVFCIVLLVAAIFAIISYIKLAQAFGKSGGFLVGMFFVPVVFLCIIAFGKSEYQGYWDKEGYHPNTDGYGPGPVPAGANPYAAPTPSVTPGTYNPGATTSVDEIPEAPRYCSGCGTKIIPGSKFCANCGKQFEK
ncbi:MAG: DUF5684 domain-containing protein [Eubacterium sp.]|nr:DUF5684 domain-containing protein [Eubacterium sp.]